MHPPSPDDKDHRIIEILRGNSRASIRDIASQTHIRPSTVHQRLQRLIKEKVIEQFTLKLNNAQVGEGFIAFVLIAASKHLPNAFLQRKEIKEVFGVTGEYDLLLKVKFKNVESFNDFIISFRNQPGITKTLTMIATTNIKEQL
ncbi:MAG TPA: Lrp/AsnC family transcriptional regulator [Candidatus Nanoarchaeia archaeon]|nr:Lrp/AsnC family transcriptional regulator [Candidatus Nanoarchaeia archaeon]